MDLGPHVVGLLADLGIEPDYSTLKTRMTKCPDPLISGNEYGETEMQATFNAKPGRYLTEDCY